MVLGLLATLALPGPASAWQFPFGTAPAEEPAPPPPALNRGGFLGLALAYSTVNGEPATLVGSRGAWMINHHLAVGGAGMATLTQMAFLAGEAPSRLTFGYGGLWTEYVVAPSRRVHGSLGLLMGAGSVAYRRLPDGIDGGAGPRSDGVLVVDPTLSLEINVVEFMRLVLSADYRFVTDVDLAELGGGRMTAPGMGMLLKFGKF